MGAKNQGDLDSWNECRSLASDLVDCFIEREILYKDLRDGWDELPPRDILLTNVMNSRQQNKTETINEVARWVQTWDEDLINTPSQYKARYSSNQTQTPNQSS